MEKLLKELTRIVFENLSKDVEVSIRKELTYDDDEDAYNKVNTIEIDNNEYEISDDLYDYLLNNLSVKKVCKEE